MGKNSTCTVPNCKTGYRSSKKNVNESKPALHGFPTDEEMIDRWKKAIPRNWAPNGKSINVKTAVVCSLHFTENDYRDKGLTSHRPLNLRLLKKNAVPSKFPNSCLMSKQEHNSATKTKAIGKIVKNKKIIRVVNTNQIHALDDLKQSMSKCDVPSDLLIQSEDTSLTYFLMGKQCQGAPVIIFSLFISADLTFEIYKDNRLLPLSVVNHILPSNKIRTTSDVLKILTTLRTYQTSKLHPSKYIEKQIQAILNVLPDLEEDEASKSIAFFMEQALLALRPLKERHYSPSLSTVASVWQSISPSLYKYMAKEGLLALPTAQYISNLSSELKSYKYLESKFNSLQSDDTKVSIIIDTVKLMEDEFTYSEGRLVDAENIEPSKSILYFFITSVTGLYKDTASIIPTTGIISSDLIHDSFLSVLKMLTSIGFDVVGVISDGRNYYKKFIEKILKNDEKFIENPFSSGKRIYFLYNMAYIFKNIYNDFLFLGAFDCPPYNENAISANFKHIHDLCDKENLQPVKWAHKLNSKVINPKSLEETNVKLAHCLFHDSTISGLKTFANKKIKWKETINFFSLIKEFWCRVNVKSELEARRFNDRRRTVVDSMDCKTIMFIKKFYKWICEWENSKTPGLNKDTFYCLKHSLTGVMELSIYMLRCKELDFVLLGHISSNSIETCFSKRLQRDIMTEISMKQLLEVEEEIRLSKLFSLSEISLKEFQYKYPSVRIEDPNEFAHIVNRALPNIDLSDPIIQNVKGFVYYVSGYISRSVLDITLCQKCSKLLIKPHDDLPQVFNFSTQENEPAEIKQLKEDLMNMNNEVQFASPSDLVYLTSTLAAKLYLEIMSNDESKAIFFSFSQSDQLFSSISAIRIEGLSKISSILEVICEAGHQFRSFIPLISKKFILIMIENFISYPNTAIIPSNVKRKNDDTNECPTSEKITKGSSE